MDDQWAHAGWMTDIPYTHGHHDSVLRSHRWRTAENSAGYLLGHLQPGMALLDVGCGPGTITCDLARRLSPGPGRRHRCLGRGHRRGHGRLGAGIPSRQLRGGRSLRPRVRGRDASTWSTPTRCSSTWATRWPPWSRCAGSAVPEASWPPGTATTRRCATSPTIRRWRRAFDAYGALTRANGANWDAGRRLLHWALEVGFSVGGCRRRRPGASPPPRTGPGGETCGPTGSPSRRWPSSCWPTGIATPEDLSSFADAYRRWAAAPDGWFAVLHGEIICTV